MVPERLDALVRADEDLLIGLRRSLHAHPELSGAGVRRPPTWCAQHLRDLGLAPRTAGGRHGPRLRPAGGPPATRPADRSSRCAPTSTRWPCTTTRTSPTAPASTGSRTRAATTYTRPSSSAPLACWSALAHRGPASPGTVRLVFEPAEESVPGGAVDVIAEGWLDGVSRDLRPALQPQARRRADRVPDRRDHLGRRPRRGTAPRSRAGTPRGPQRTVDLVGLLGRLVTGLQPALDTADRGARACCRRSSAPSTRATRPTSSRRKGRCGGRCAPATTRPG